MKKNNIPLNFTEKNKSKISLICSIAVLLLLCILLHFVDKSAAASQEKKAKAEAAEQAKADAEKEAANAPAAMITVGAVGNNRYDSGLIDSGKSDTGDWNYDEVYSLVKNQISGYDIALAVQTTSFTDDHNMVSGSPAYATPTEVGDALATAGFDVVASASDHIDDNGSSNISKTLNYWSSNHSDITVLGIHGDQTDADTVKVIEKNGIKVAFLSYTYGSSTGNLTDEQSYMVDYFQKDKVTADIAKAKEISDCIVLSAQWGPDANSIPTEYEKEWANYLLSQGVNVVIGSRPQVLQPYELLTDGQGNEMLVFYSLGNFASGAEESPRLLGGIGEFTIEKSTAEGEPAIKITNSSITPTVMHYNTTESVYQIYPLADYTDELAAAHSIHNMENPGSFTKSGLQTLFDHIMSEQVTPATGTELLDYTYNSDGSMTKADGSVIYEDEISTLNPTDETGSLESLKNVLSGSSPDTSGSDGTDTDSQADGDSDYSSDSDTGYDSDSSYDSSY